MSKHFIISKEVVEGTVVTEEGFVFEFDRDEKFIRVEGRRICFTEIRDHIESLNALAWALRDSIDEAIEEAQDNSLPDIVGDDTDHIG